ncbi:hypothetical protein [Ligilactobacillus acidipiscis]|uniref:hypothetical protein n=1 Tax=Ligilactobacillus acidipiscis TaxID=89059 RepID=UPI0023F6C1A0|nr:hypothetical protein [Ligilactobacillus acidipiscis]WEV57096.1 hypothetical protein OZX66_00700 [Ligilactobacillus acidipiscis]
MKSNKAIAAQANQLMTIFKVENAASGVEVQKIIDQAQEKLDKRQIPPQKIIEEVVLAMYSLKVKGIISISDAAFKTLKEMEKLSRQRSWLPFRPYDPW